jgi:hypothetical protein
MNCTSCAIGYHWTEYDVACCHKDGSVLANFLPCGDYRPLDKEWPRIWSNLQNDYALILKKRASAAKHYHRETLLASYMDQVADGVLGVPIDDIPYYEVHHAVADEVACLLDRKREAYGTENINKFGEYGILIRASDKVNRLMTLLNNGKKSMNQESVVDTWMDLAGYAILALVLMQREGGISE